MTKSTANNGKRWTDAAPSPEGPRGCRGARECTSTDYEDSIEALDRLRRHAASVREGSPTARDDLAVVLQILVGSGKGYGLLQRVFEDLKIPLLLPLPSGDLADTVDGYPVILALRTAGPCDDPGSAAPLDQVLDAPCLRYAPDLGHPAFVWSWRELIEISRHKYGAHADLNPPRWLSQLRYFPIANQDVATLLLWSLAEELLRSSTRSLFARGIAVSEFEPTDQYLDGVELSEAIVSGDNIEHLDVRARIRADAWASDRPRAVIGATFGTQPFLFSLLGDGRVSLQTGQVGQSPAELYKALLETWAQMPPRGHVDSGLPVNRAARRAQARAQQRRTGR